MGNPQDRRDGKHGTTEGAEQGERREATLLSGQAFGKTLWIFIATTLIPG
jgi:hypothetical protein